MSGLSSSGIPKSTARPRRLTVVGANSMVWVRGKTLGNSGDRCVSPTVSDLCIISTNKSEEIMTSSKRPSLRAGEPGRDGIPGSDSLRSLLKENEWLLNEHLSSQTLLSIRSVIPDATPPNKLRVSIPREVFCKRQVGCGRSISIAVRSRGIFQRHSKTTWVNKLRSIVHPPNHVWT